MTEHKIKKKDIIYYAQMMPSIPQFEVIELKVRTVSDTWFSTTENKTKHTYLFCYKDIGGNIFFDRKECLMIVKQAEKEYRKKNPNTILEDEMERN